MKGLRTVRIGMAAALLMLGASNVSAQVLGPFNWQMQPFCNIVTLTLTTTPAGFRVDGFDELCGGASKASAVGFANFNAFGLVTINFTIVIPPSGKAVHVAAVINTGDGNGTWVDSVGNSGTFVFGGANLALPARPLPASGVAPATITSVEIASNAVGASEIAAGAVGSSEIAAGAVGAAAFSGITRRSATSGIIAPGGAGNVGVQCGAGEQVLSGGNDASSAINIVIVASRNDGANGWRIFARNDSAGNQTVTVHAYCLNP